MIKINNRDLIDSNKFNYVNFFCFFRTQLFDHFFSENQIYAIRFFDTFNSLIP